MSLLLPGTAIVYYGDEIGMTSGPPEEEISFEDTRDPYALPPYANQSNYHLYSRDPNRTPMQVDTSTLLLQITLFIYFVQFQWTNGTNANFTTAAKPWIPILKDVLEANVQYQDNRSEMTHLTLFKKIMLMRQYPAFHSGKVYYPFRDRDIFSFLR